MLQNTRRMIAVSLMSSAIATMAAPAAQANIVSDPSFELDNGSWSTFTPPDGGWAIANFGRGANTGSNSIGTGCIDVLFGCTFSQTLTTTPGATYDIRFWLYTDGLEGGLFESPNGLRVSFDGVIVQTILDFPTTNPSSTDFFPGGPSTLFSISNALASTGSTVLQFAGYHLPSGIFVDDVSVELAAAPAAVPEPATLGILGGSLLILGAMRRRRKAGA